MVCHLPETTSLFHSVKNLDTTIAKPWLSTLLHKPMSIQQALEQTNFGVLTSLRKMLTGQPTSVDTAVNDILEQVPANWIR
jgi:hypothetical protein